MERGGVLPVLCVCVCARVVVVVGVQKGGSKGQGKMIKMERKTRG